MAPHSVVPFRIASMFVVGFALTAPAHAELPEAAKQMITNAAREGDPAELAAIVKFARRTYPDDSIAIDQLLLSLQPVAAAVANAPAQVKAPKPVAVQAEVVPPKPEIKWSGRGEFGGFHTSGNTDSFGVTVGANLALKGPMLAHQLRLRGDYQESNGKKSREYLNAAYQADWKISGRHYALGILDYERDVIAGFDHRATSSIGVGWRAIDEESVLLSLEAGPAIRHDWLRDGDDATSLAGRGALTSSWQMNDKVKLSNNVEMVAQSTNNTLRTVTGLQAKLTSRISSQISYDMRYQDRPLFGTDEVDTITRIGVTYDF